MSNSSQKKWVSDIIKNDYKSWESEFVILDCGTGCGKTYFCITILGMYAKNKERKILYLCNRSELRKEVFNEINFYGLKNIVWVETYQTLQKKIQQKMKIPYYDYIVVDECHYFTTDAKFNDYTDISYDYLMKQKQSVVLWVSATAKIFFNYLENKNKVKKKNIYRISKDYTYVKNVYFYQKDELSTIINDVLENELDSKIVVFCNSANRMKEMNKIYGDTANYFCSKSTTSMELKKICGYDTKSNIISNSIKQLPDGRSTFEKRILFTTTVLDNGVNLKDEKIKHIFSEIFDADSMIQSLGRKRSLTKDDLCTFYIREYKPKAIQGLLNINNSQLEPVFSYKNDYDNFFKEYGTGKKRRRLSKNRIFYSFFTEDKKSKIKINDCRYRKYEQDNNILLQMRDIGYVPIIRDFLGEDLSSKCEHMVVDVRKIDIFLEYLKSIEGIQLFSENIDRIKEEFETIGVKLRYSRGINTFNGSLDDVYKDLYKHRFYNTDIDGKTLIDKRRKLDDGSINPNRDKRYWILECR
ncbi:DEAD/DEAH box helicase family protein [Kineothrix sp. MB12-C1]|uniref:DEAD/DEAH box helicase family protein n=1 Tax=Kineothrix sp. MB12-C1 TaxID=3070215 RepID=UPI0027D2B302|nr:DEAD/DEAH box helicase family protein [Kineothrix sp. MB12-C1]WMC93207.1 DEAD/DEAH box helicase family protein [Kineothrix sp. MB12-C1]